MKTGSPAAQSRGVVFERTKGSVMCAPEIQFERATAPEMFVPETTLADQNVSAMPVRKSTISSTDRKWGHALESTAEESCETVGPSLLPLVRDDAVRLRRMLRQVDVPRIAFKAKGTILLFNLADILAVQAEGNYVSLRHRGHPYLVHESLSSMAEKLKPYGFIRIHRSVLVNISTVEEIQPLPTGEYRLRVKGGKEYLVTRTYKHNLRDLAELWIG